MAAIPAIKIANATKISLFWKDFKSSMLFFLSDDKKVTTEKIARRQKKRWKFRTQKISCKFDESTASHKGFLAEKYLL